MKSLARTACASTKSRWRQYFLPGLAALALTVCAAAESASRLAEALAAIRAVGPEGQGNASASAAWKKLIAGDGGSLLAILGAMDGASDYALNWLRPAVDAIASRELKAGGKLPLAELGKFLLETSHHPRARRLAYEVVAHADPAVAERMLMGMLNDPSLELRYAAVQKLVDQADETVARSNQLSAALLYRQAIGAARDATQIEALAKKLAGLGQPVELVQHFGFLTQWQVIGPFDNSGRRGFETAFPPETKIDLTAEYDGKGRKVRWQSYTTTHEYGMVDMNKPCGKIKEVTAYAVTDFFSDTARAVELRLGGKNSWKVWLNGKFLFGHDEYHANCEIDQYIMPAQLQAGRNMILVKVCQNEEVEEWTNEWEFQLRVTDSLGTPVRSVAPVSSNNSGVSN